MPEDLFSLLSDGGTPPRYKWFNGSQWTASKNGHFIDVISPIDNSIVGKLPVVTHEEIDAALMKAKAAQKEWIKIPIIKRAKLLNLAADWIREHEEYLTNLLIREIAKTQEEGKDEILRSADMIDYYSHEALSLHGEQLPSDAFPGYEGDKVSIIERVPLGIIAAIAPFNYPVNLSVSKLAPALVSGNAVIFKPPLNGGISGLHLTEVFRKAGIPEGLLICVTGEGADIGEYLVKHPMVNMITFTGSSQVGKHIAEEAGMIPLLFECGGNNPALLVSGFDVEITAGEIVKGAFSYAGQRCTAIKYVLGVKADLDKVIPRVVEITKEKIKVGDVRDPSTKLGPLVSEKAAKEVEARIIAAQQMGAKVLLGGKRIGNLVEPTILTNVDPHADIVRIETFGPVVSFIEVKNLDEAIDIVNSSDYGLQAAIYTSDEGTGIRMAKRIEVGTVWINSKPQRGPDHYPFLGIKGSGVGTQGIRYSLEAMTRLKPIVLNKPQ